MKKTYIISKKLILKVAMLLFFQVFSVQYLQSQDWYEHSKIFGEPILDTYPRGYFGEGVATDGEYMVVTEPDGYTINGVKSGLATVFGYNIENETWEREAVLTPSDGYNAQEFGSGVAISGDVVVVGAFVDNENGSKSGAAYVFEKSEDGWADMTETAKLTASDGAIEDFLGRSVAISDDVIVVGAEREDENGFDSGSAYVFEKPVSGWADMTETAKLGASDGATSDSFGFSVGISADVIVVGSPADDDNGSGSGSAYVFEKPEDGWADMTETAKLIASNGSGNDAFGYSVAISESTVVVGASGDDDNGSSSGSAYVFEKSASGWIDMTETAMLTASDGAANDFFGFNVSISEDVVLVGANGDDDVFNGSGSAYVFEKAESGWSTMTETIKLTAFDASSNKVFGISVSISDHIIIGAYGDSDLGTLSGSAYVFEKPESGWSMLTEEDVTKLLPSNIAPNRISQFFGYKLDIDGDYAVVSTGKEVVFVIENIEGVWQNVAELSASDGVVSDYFGNSVAISGNTIVVGAYGDDDNGSSSGSVYVFEKPDDGWSTMNETAKLVASDGVASDFFSYNSVAISGDVVVVGALQDDDNGSASGSAYVFEKPESGWVDMTESVKLTASDGAANDFFGSAIAISGDDVVVGAYSNESASGSAYLFEKPDGGWVDMFETAKLTASDASFYDEFGRYLDIDGDVIVVGSYADDDNGDQSGSAYVFEKPESGWFSMTETAKLIASDGATEDEFGSSVSISGSVVVIGAHKNDDFGSSSGSAYLFERPVKGWTNMSETLKLISADVGSTDYFGYSVSVSDDMVLIGAYLDDDKDIDSGAAYFFKEKSDQTIVFDALSAKEYGDVPFGLTAVASSGLEVTYTSSDETVATISGSTVTIIGAGETVITASQAGDNAYYSAEDVSQTLTVNKTSLTATADDLNLSYGEAIPTLTISYDGFVNGETVDVLIALPTATTDANSLSDVGEYTISITGGEADNYDFTYLAGTLTIVKADQIITFDAIADVDVASVMTVSPNATASSGLDISYSITQGADIASIAEGVITLSGTGIVTIEASQEGNGNYNAATSVSQTFHAIDSRKSDQTITFNALSAQTYGDASFNLTATASSGLDVSYVSSDENVAKVDGSTVTIFEVGVTSITASQVGDNQFNPAMSVSQDLTVGMATLTITADDQQINEGDDVPALTMSYSGFVNNEDESVITVPVISTDATSSSSVGTYNIVLDGGSADNYNLILIDGILTISEVLGLLTEHAITVYPNPTIDVLTISDTSVSIIEVYDLKGALILSANLQSKSLSVSALKEGIYVLKLLDKQGHILSTNRMIKK